MSVHLITDFTVSGPRQSRQSHLSGAGIQSGDRQSPHRYVLTRRLERAKELLRNTEMPVVDVALSSGFSSQSHLSYWFQRNIDVSPAVYRQHRAV